MSESLYIFDRKLVQQHRRRAATHFPEHDFLVREAAERLADRFDDMARTFPTALELGAHTGLLASLLQGRGGIEQLIQTDISHRMLKQSHGKRVVVDEEHIPFAPQTFDVIVSALSLHWVNDVPGMLMQLWHCLKPDGLLMVSLLGGETLKELRQAFLAAEMELTGGVSPRLSPFIDTRDAAGLLQRCGFEMPVADCDTIKVNYSSMFELMKDLRGMGETNTLLERSRTPATRTLLQHTAQKYQEMFPYPEGGIEASFDIITMTGWRPKAV